MEENDFWYYIEITKKQSNNDTDFQEELLRRRLASLAPEKIRAFNNVYVQLHGKAFNYNLWAAAALVNEGCSDDDFIDFRDWLILQGREIYYQALENTDSLVNIIYPCLGWAVLATRVNEAYEWATGQSLPEEVNLLDEYSPGNAWDGLDQAAERCPLIAAKFYRL